MGCFLFPSSAPFTPLSGFSRFRNEGSIRFMITSPITIKAETCNLPRRKKNAVNRHFWLCILSTSWMCCGGKEWKHPTDVWDSELQETTSQPIREFYVKTRPLTYYDKRLHSGASKSSHTLPVRFSKHWRGVFCPQVFVLVLFFVSTRPFIQWSLHVKLCAAGTDSHSFIPNSNIKDQGVELMSTVNVKNLMKCRRWGCSNAVWDLLKWLDHICIFWNAANTRSEYRRKPLPCPPPPTLHLLLPSQEFHRSTTGRAPWSF